MTVRLTRLRIAGFKSFAEPVVLTFADGLTGIVGPNGCGKSNVVDALRWVMGESSARSMRGGEMDDIIFAGTAHRPSRNLAEVTISLETGDRPAPSPWHDAPEIEISRKITRGGGSVFRVNGRETRARDVGTLLADLGSGSDSAALVGQGRVAALIAAKPADRRAVLEEAAGITGLAARRHEAETKLRAADANLLRSDDTLAQLRDRAAALAGQAEAAAKYRTLGDAIRAAEAEFLTITKILAGHAVASGQAALAAAEAASADAAIAATRAAASHTDAAAALPGCETAETAARDASAAAKTNLALIAAQAAQTEAASRAARILADDLARDLAAAERAVRDGDAALARLDAELVSLAAAEMPGEIARAEAAASGTALAAREADAVATTATEAAAAAAAHRQSAEAVLAAAERRHADAARTQAASATTLTQALRDTPPEHALRDALCARDEADAARLAAQDAADAADAAREAAADALARAQSVATDAAADRAQVLAEHAALTAALAPPSAAAHTPIADRLTVPPGLEAAVTGAMGATLDAGTDSSHGAYWQTPPSPPEATASAGDAGGQVTLDTLVTAPAELARALAHVVLVDAINEATELAPGWTAVSRDGAARRWDGYTVRPGAAPAIALRLTQRNRFAAVEAARPAAETRHAAAQTALAEVRARDGTAHAARSAARAAVTVADAAARAAQAALARVQTAAAAGGGKLTAAQDRDAAANAALAEATAARLGARARTAALPDLAQLRGDQGAARLRLDAARGADQEASRQLAALIRAAEERARRAVSANAERADWAPRRAAAAAQSAQLAARAEAAAVAAEAAARAPEAAAAHLAEAQAAAAEAAALAAASAQALRLAQDRAADAAQGARAADRDAAAGRDAVLRLTETLAAARVAAEAADARVAERLGAAPLPDCPDSTPEACARAQRRHDRLARERDALGAVNLLAETELAETTARATAMQSEAAELTTAIAKLRGSIGYLNREGRERLTAVFSDVDRHFQSLFGRLFQGGRAHLALTGSDDVLAAGLEIFVQPPGKKLATLSLLSGGEQALTALCLIFAIFRCNPAPVCVLDEVDAPLDDANVDRFCTLIADLAAETATRFLVVTHHPQTMARTDRLFGVTMQERGVSRLLSVDLGTATRMVETPKMAAE